MEYVPHEPEKLEYLMNDKLGTIRDILSQRDEKPNETIKYLRRQLDQLAKENQKLKRDANALTDRWMRRQSSALRDISQVIPQSPRTPMEKRVIEVKKSGIPKFVTKELVQKPVVIENNPEREAQLQKELEEVLGILPKTPG
ncbi:hypothetical protein NEOLI_004709 [Neolecta irregularis DAH-3]|uniref:Uncharacterized protein n=1 Tax=Neolecta irregularis (strain DAH-3) TaxID=1198029 RepID=A0A1U7LMM2_NEOID|nr:hypothetical protein NEOLI_004709 [Neolecta irregularis DAH-3]|eukprot:OLL23916.1 hypothetical protein NEOLI_004709 [Neolecta irregularis DAH-3]